MSITERICTEKFVGKRLSPVPRLIVFIGIANSNDMLKAILNQSDILTFFYQ